MDPLKCPCCGGKAVVRFEKKEIYKQPHLKHFAKVVCTVCSLSLSRCADDGLHGGYLEAQKAARKAAVEAWNFRLGM